MSMDWVRILAYATGTLGQELLLRNEYLVAENRILKAQLKTRLRLTDAEGHVDPLKLPVRSPNLSAHAERWVSSVMGEALSKLILTVTCGQHLSRAFLVSENSTVAA